MAKILLVSAAILVCVGMIYSQGLLDNCSRNAVSCYNLLDCCTLQCIGVTLTQNGTCKKCVGDAGICENNFDCCDTHICNKQTPTSYYGTCKRLIPEPCIQNTHLCTADSQCCSGNCPNRNENSGIGYCH